MERTTVVVGNDRPGQYHAERGDVRTGGQYHNDRDVRTGQYHTDQNGRVTPASSRMSTLSAVLKVLEIILAIIIICLIAVRPYDDENHVVEYKWWYPMTTGEEFTIATCAFALFFALHFLLLFIAGCHRGGHPLGCTCHKMAGGVYVLIAIMFIISAGVEVWMTTLYRDWGRWTRYNMRAAASAFCFLEAILFLINVGVTRFLDV